MSGLRWGLGAHQRSPPRHGLRSIGRLFHEPIWVFTRGDLPLESLRDLKNKKILVGGEQTATRRISMQLLKANGVDAANATLQEATLSGDATQTHKNEAHAAILILPPENERIQQLLRVDDIRLMDFLPEVCRCAPQVRPMS